MISVQHLAIAVLFAGTSACADRPVGKSETGDQDGDPDKSDPTTPARPVPTYYRLTKIALRDPHLFIAVAPFVPCTDITNHTPAGPGLNPRLSAGLSQDVRNEQGQTQPDGYLDSSPLFAISQPVQRGDSPTLAFANGRCTAPAETTHCELDSSQNPVSIPAIAIATGACFDVPPGSVNKSYGTLPVPAAPCIATPTFDLPLDPLGFSGTLHDATVVFGSEDENGQLPGMLVGLLTSEDAQAIEVDLGTLGTRSLASLLAGGPGACPRFDDRDQNAAGQTGWMMYFELRGENTPIGEGSGHALSAPGVAK